MHQPERRFGEARATSLLKSCGKRPVPPRRKSRCSSIAGCPRAQIAKVPCCTEDHVSVTWRVCPDATCALSPSPVEPRGAAEPVSCVRRDGCASSFTIYGRCYMVEKPISPGEIFVVDD